MILSEKVDGLPSDAIASLLDGYYNVYAIKYSHDAGEWWDEYSEEYWNKTLHEIRALLFDICVAKEDFYKTKNDDLDYNEWGESNRRLYDGHRRIQRMTENGT